MTDLNKAAVDKSLTFTGEYGNANVEPFNYTAASVASGTKIYLGKIAKYSTVNSVSVFHGALGGSTTIDVGYETAEPGGSLVTDGDYWVAGQSTASAGRTDTTALPKAFTEEIYITATIGGATATGAISVVVESKYTSF